MANQHIFISGLTVAICIECIKLINIKKIYFAQQQVYNAFV